MKTVSVVDQPPMPVKDTQKNPKAIPSNYHPPAAHIPKHANKHVQDKNKHRVQQPMSRGTNHQ